MARGNSGKKYSWLHLSNITQAQALALMLIVCADQCSESPKSASTRQSKKTCSSMDPPHPIHWIYRLTFTIIEPIMAFSGACQIHFDPASYLAIANPNVVFDPSIQPLLTSILGGWLVICFNDLVTLRVFSRNVKLWQLVLSAHLLSDLAYSYAVYQDMGTARLLNPVLWSRLHWLTLGTTIPPMVMKMTFLLGSGVEGLALDEPEHSKQH